MAKRAVSAAGTAEKKARVLRGLAETGYVAQACAEAGVGRRTAQEWCAADPAFKAAWDDALAAYAEALEAEADRRAVRGIDKPVHYQGKRIDTLKDYSDSLLVFRLKALKPDTYRERPPGAAPAAPGGSIALTINWVKPEDGDEG